MTGRLTTGLEILDRNVNGGIPPGSLVALVAPPESQSELLLDAVATAGPALYLTSVRAPDEVRESMGAAGRDTSELKVREYSSDDLRNSVDALLTGLDERDYVVFDTAERIESLERLSRQSVLNYLKRKLRENDAVGLIHCLGLEKDEERRFTLHRADLVWMLDLVRTSLSIENRLYITKFRGGAAMTQPVKLRLTDQVSIDTSRDIA